jgi:hypothetical protein
VVRVVAFSVGDALRLAAGLTRVCSAADRLDRSFNGGEGSPSERPMI